MGLRSRLSFLFRSKATAAIDRIEDPRETLDYASEQQQELLLRVRRGLVDVATSKRQVERRMQRVREGVPRLEDQARRAVDAGRDDLARAALQRRQAALIELEELDRQATEIGAEEMQLAGTEQALAARIEEFKTRRQVMSARYTAAEAQVRVNEAISGLSGELAELGRALGRAEEKTERMQVRASALDALLDPNALALPSIGGDEVERELRRIEAGDPVEAQLAALKRHALAPPVVAEGAEEKVQAGKEGLG